MKRKLVVAATAGALAVALALVLSACGGSDDSDGVASLTNTTGQSSGNGSQGSGGGGTGGNADREQAQLDYARCMREHGVDFPDPRNGRFEFRVNRRDQRKAEEAQRACGHILEDAMPQLSEEQEAELREAALDYARCMREHGIDVPDPTFQPGGGTLMRVPRGAENDPKFEEAQEACQPILEDAAPEGPTGQDPS